MKIIKPDEGEVLDIELEEDFLKRNRKLAEENRVLLDKNKVKTVDVMGSIGSGKTSLIQLLTSNLTKRFRIGVIAGDLTTDIDAKRLKQNKVQVLVRKALQSLPLDAIDIIFIENVGNLICPADFPLGAHKRLVVISVTEGPWMVVKHPYIFKDANVVAINKVDLADSMQVSPKKLIEDVARINPDAKSIPISCRQNQGIMEIIEALAF